MFDYDSYYNRLNKIKLDSQLDYPSIFNIICDSIITVEYASGTVVAFDAEFFYENAQFIIARCLIHTLRLKNAFEHL